MCRKTADLEAANWRYASLHEELPYHDGSFESWRKERSVSHPFRYDSGVRLWVSDVDYDPDGTWLGAAEQSHRD